MVVVRYEWLGWGNLSQDGILAAYGGNTAALVWLLGGLALLLFIGVVSRSVARLSDGHFEELGAGYDTKASNYRTAHLEDAAGYVPPSPASLDPTPVTPSGVPSMPRYDAPYVPEVSATPAAAAAVAKSAALAARYAATPSAPSTTASTPASMTGSEPAVEISAPEQNPPRPMPVTDAPQVSDVDATTPAVGAEALPVAPVDAARQRLAAMIERLTGHHAHYRAALASEALAQLNQAHQRGDGDVDPALLTADFEDGYDANAPAFGKASAGSSDNAGALPPAIDWNAVAPLDLQQARREQLGLLADVEGTSRIYRTAVARDAIDRIDRALAGVAIRPIPAPPAPSRRDVEPAATAKTDADTQPTRASPPAPAALSDSARADLQTQLQALQDEAAGIDQSSDPLHWATLQHQLGQTALSLGLAGQSSDALDIAEQSEHAALDVFDSSGARYAAACARDALERIAAARAGSTPWPVADGIGVSPARGVIAAFKPARDDIVGSGAAIDVGQPHAALTDVASPELIAQLTARRLDAANHRSSGFVYQAARADDDVARLIAELDRRGESAPDAEPIAVASAELSSGSPDVSSDTMYSNDNDAVADAQSGEGAEDAGAERVAFGTTAATIAAAAAAHSLGRRGDGSETAAVADEAADDAAEDVDEQGRADTDDAAIDSAMSDAEAPAAIADGAADQEATLHNANGMADPFAADVEEIEALEREGAVYRAAVARDALERRRRGLT